MSQSLKLDQKLRLQVQTERKITHEILLTLQEIDITQIYRELGHSSLFDYLVKSIGYSESAANRRISAARLLKSVPEIAPKIQEGKINLSQLALVQSAIKQEERKTSRKVTKDKKQQTLQILEGKSHFESQKVLLESFENFELPKPKVIPTKNKRIQINLEFNEQDWKKIKDLLNYMSHKVPDQKLESALLYWASQVEKKKHDSTNQKQIVNSEGKLTQDNKLANTDEKTGEQHNSPPNRRYNQRRYISVKIKNQIFKAANHQCQFVSEITGNRCESKSYLDTEHRRPLALGGSDQKENLRVMCRAHNLLMAKRMHLSKL